MIVCEWVNVLNKAGTVSFVCIKISRDKADVLLRLSTIRVIMHYASTLAVGHWVDWLSNY